MREIKIFRKGNNYLTAKVNLAGLENLKETLNKKLVTYVGIMGSNNRLTKETGETHQAYKARVKKAKKAGEVAGEGNLNNATIGMIHEFGSFTKGIPERSFLRMPLMFHLKKAVEEAASRINKAIEAGDAVKAYKILGIAAEEVVQRAFDTGGFGQWSELKKETIDRKGSSAVLIDTKQLRDSITSKVVAV